jgi:uncharacterized membrane protein
LGGFAVVLSSKPPQLNAICVLPIHLKPCLNTFWYSVFYYLFAIALQPVFVASGFLSAAANPTMQRAIVGWMQGTDEI